MGIKSSHSALLNRLDDMAASPHYAMRRNVLREAESLILRQEQEIIQLKEQLNAAQETRTITGTLGSHPS